MLEASRLAFDPLIPWVLLWVLAGGAAVLWGLYVYLRGKSWDITDTTRTDLFSSNGRPLPAPENDDPLGEIIYVNGTLAS